MVLTLILDSKNLTSSQPMIADTPQSLLDALIQMNPENLSDLSVQPILYFDSIEDLVKEALKDAADLDAPEYLPLSFTPNIKILDEN